MSKFPCSLTRNMTSHSMENLTFHSLLRWKVIILQILATSRIQLLFERLGEYTFWAQEWTIKDAQVATGHLLPQRVSKFYLKVKWEANRTVAHSQVCIPDSKMPTFYRRSRITSRGIRISSWKNPKLSENTFIWPGGPGPHFWRHTWHSPWDRC